MNTNLLQHLGRTGMVASTLVALAGAPSRAADKAPGDAFPTFESYIKLSGYGAEVHGNESAYAHRNRQDPDGGVGIEDLHVTKEVTKSTTLILDGRALTGSEDYLGKINLAKSEVGTVDVGFKRFRTFYDGIGGFFPLNNQWAPLANEELHIDRAKFWAEATLTLPNAPVFTLRYTNELRSGRKDSTIWGDSDFTGLPNNVAPLSPARKIAPSFINVGERHEVLEATVKHTIKRTTFEFAVRGDRTNNLDTRYLTRFPGEAKLFPTPAATVLVPAANMGNQVQIAEIDGMKTKTSEFTGEADTVLTDRITLRLGGVYELIHTEIIGDRPLITSTPTATGVVLVGTDNYQGLTGGTRVKNFTGKIALDLKLTKDLFVKLALRAQDEFIRGASSFTVVAASGTPAVTLASTPRLGWAKVHQNVTTPVLELRYTGIRDVALYFTGSKRNLNGEERNTSAYNYLTAASGTMANNDVSEDHGNYTLGANWRQSTFLTLRGEVFHKGHQDSTAGFGPSVGDYYLLDSKYDGYKLTALAKPTAELGFTTRFVSQHGRMKVTGFLPTYPAYDSLNAKNYMLGETIDWTPSGHVYVQLTGNAVFNVISTVYPRAGYTAPTATNVGFDSNRVLQNSNNNYYTVGVLTGFTVDKATDLQIQANYYRADNGDAFLAPLTQPYGVAAKETTVTVGVKHKFSEKWIGHAKVGYFESTNDTTGGNTNFRGPRAYFAVEYGL